MTPLVNTTSTAYNVLGQIISYATLILSSQYCTHTFSVLIVKDHTWLICWDCSGAIIIEPIKYNKDSSLFDFLIHYNNAGRVMHGQNPTVDSPTKGEEQDAQMLDDLAHAKFLQSITIQDPITLEHSHPMWFKCGNSVLHTNNPLPREFSVEAGIRKMSFEFSHLFTP